MLTSNMFFALSEIKGVPEGEWEKYLEEVWGRGGFLHVGHWLWTIHRKQQLASITGCIFLCAKGGYCKTVLWWKTCTGQAWWREEIKHKCNKNSFIWENGTALTAKICFLEILSSLWVHAVWHCWWLLLCQLESVPVLCLPHSCPR